MKTKHSLCLLALVCVGFLLPFTGNAQVTIGSEKTPESFSVLELISNNTKGLRLPQMTTAQRDALALASLTGDAATRAQGLQIFNTITKCVETWNGATWITACAPPDSPTPIAHTQVMFTGWRQGPTTGPDAETVGDLYPKGENIRWYDSPTGGTAIPKTTPFTTGRDQVTELEYYVCAVGADNIESERVPVQIKVGECGVKTSDENNGLIFQCHNLDADQSLDPFTPAQGLHGAKYKFGSANYALSMVNDAHADGNTTPPLPNSSVWEGLSTYQTDGNWDMDSNNPCPDGWVVPTIDQWADAVTNQGFNLQISIPDSEWTSGVAEWENGKLFGNYLFLPTVGGRDYSDGKLSARGSRGYYWSSTQDSPLSYRGRPMTFSSSTTSTTNYYGRTFGLSIRCVAE